MIKSLLTLCFATVCCLCRAEEIGLANGRIDIRWTRTAEGWKLTRLRHADGKEWGTPDGRYTVLYSVDKPDTETPLTIRDADGDSVGLVEPTFRNVQRDLRRSVTEVPLNRAGTAYAFYPETALRTGDSIRFSGRCPVGRIEAVWWLDERFPDDIRVRTTFIPDRAGYYSLSSATPAVLNPARLSWGVVPGWFQGCEIQPDFRLAYLYGQGLPRLPVVCRESTLTTLASVLSAENGLTLAVIPEEGQDRDPYEKDANTHYTVWKIGLSHKNRAGQLCPTAYHPVLGEAGSQRAAGEAFGFDYRYTLSHSGWYEPYRHAIYDVYGLREGLALRRSTLSLTDRLYALHDYAVDDSLSLWRVEELRGMMIGAQAYRGSVVGSEGDAMKNSDVGSVWMLAAATDDPRLGEERLPYIRNFKLAQQEEGGDYLSGSAKGQYYLSKRQRFVEEWGGHTEPIALTYYVLCDLGNMLLFEPQDTLLRRRLRLGADRLLAWQHADGSFDVACDKLARRPVYTDLKDLRPTFYGLAVAYRVLGDRKYLDAAVRGADWFVRNAVDKGSFVGVCGDTRFVNDFATGQSAQALLDLWELTGGGPVQGGRHPHGAHLHGFDLHAQAALRSAQIPQGQGAARLADFAGRPSVRARRRNGVGRACRTDPAHEPLRHVREDVRSDARLALPGPGARRSHRPRGAPPSAEQGFDLLLVAVRSGTRPVSDARLVADRLDKRLPPVGGRNALGRRDPLPARFRHAEGRTAADYGLLAGHALRRTGPLGAAPRPGADRQSRHGVSDHARMRRADAACDPFEQLGAPAAGPHKARPRAHRLARLGARRGGALRQRGRRTLGRHPRRHRGAFRPAGRAAHP